MIQFDLTNLTNIYQLGRNHHLVTLQPTRVPFWAHSWKSSSFSNLRSKDLAHYAVETTTCESVDEACHNWEPKDTQLGRGV